MASTTEQMEQVFGFTPQGLDQEVKKYKPEPSKGLSYGELIVDNILGLDNEYESFGEKLGKAVNEDEIKFLKDAAVGIYEGAKEFVQAPVETTKQVVNEIKNSVVSLGSEDLDTRLQRMFNVSYEQATDDQVNQAREAVLGDAFTALELIPAAAGTTTAIKMGVGAVPSGVKADVIGQTKAILSGDKEFLKGTPTEKADTAGVGANVPGMFPKSSPEDLEDIDFDPDRIKGNIDELFKLVDVKKKYGLSDTDDISDAIIPVSVTEAFPDKKLNLNNVNVNFYRPIQIDRENPFFDEDDKVFEQERAGNSITRELMDFSTEHSTFPAPILRDPNVTRENVPTFTDQQVNDLAQGQMGPDVPNQITQTTLADAVTTDYFDQVQAELLSSIDKKIKRVIPLLPIDQLARLVGLSNADTLLPQRSLDSLDKLGAEDLFDNELKNFIRDSEILEGHYVSDPRDYRSQNKNPSRENPFLDDEPDFNLVDETSFTADLTPRTSRVDGLTGRVIFETDPGKVIDGQTKYKFEAVFGRPMEESGVHPLFNINNNNSYIINGIKESLKDYLKTLDLNIETDQGDTLGEVSKLLTSEYITQRSVSRIDPGNVATELENVGKVALLELSKSVGNKPMKGARILDALEKDPRISNKNIPEYFKSSEFKGKTFNPSEFEDLADRYYKDSPLVSYPPDFGSVSFDVIQRQDLNYNPDSGKFAGGKVVDTYQRQIMAEAGPTNRVPAFTPKERQHMDQKDLAHVRYTEIEPIDVTDESAIRETYPALENRNLDSDFAKGLEEFEDIIADENYFLVDEIQSDLMKGFRKFIPIPFTKEVVKNALSKRHITDKEFQERVDSGFTQPGETNQSFMERFSSVNFEPYEDEIFEKITELLDIYHNKGGSSLAVGKDAELNKVQANFVDSIVEKERLRAPSEFNDPTSDKYILEFKLKLNNLLNQATSARLYDESQIGKGGLKGASYQAIINRKSFDTPESYQKPPIKDRKEAVQLAIQRLIFDAQKRGVNKIVIPNFDRIASNQRYDGEQLFYALQNKSYNPRTDEVKPNDALYDTYVTSLNKVLPEFEKAYGLKVYRDVTLPYVKDGMTDFSDDPIDPYITFSDKGIVIDISDIKEKFDLDKPAFAEGGDTVRPEPKPKTRPFPDVKPKERPDIVDVSPMAEKPDQDLIKKDDSFPDVKPRSRPKRVEKSGVYTEEYDLKGVPVEIPVIIFKDGERIAFEKALQTIADRGTANEPVVGIDTEDQIRKFLEERNPTREEFETYWYNKRLNKGGSVGEQMQMAFMNEGGLTDDGMNKDPVSGNEVPSGSMAEEVRDDIPAQLSEGEYVVPADVVRYYGVKFFEDLRDQAKMGLADMEANGRIGGEPVPAGGPVNDEELSPQEMQAIREMMGMAEGGDVQNPYMQQQLLYSQPRPAPIDDQKDTVVDITNPVQNQMPVQNMAAGGQIQGYQTGGLEQDFLNTGQSAVNRGFVGFPLGATIFPSERTGQTVLGPTGTQVATTDAINTAATTFTTVTLYGPNGEVVVLTLPTDLARYNELLALGYSTTPPGVTTTTTTGVDDTTTTGVDDTTTTTGTRRKRKRDKPDTDPNSWMKKFDYTGDLATNNLAQQTSDELKKAPVGGVIGAFINGQNAAEAAANIIILENNGGDPTKIAELKDEYKQFIKDTNLSYLPEQLINGDALAKDIVKNNIDIALNRDSVDINGEPIFKDDDEFNKLMQDVSSEGMEFDPVSRSYKRKKRRDIGEILRGKKVETTPAGVDVYQATEDTPRPVARPTPPTEPIYTPTASDLTAVKSVDDALAAKAQEDMIEQQRAAAREAARKAARDRRKKRKTNRDANVAAAKAVKEQQAAGRTESIQQKIKRGGGFKEGGLMSKGK